ncbi:MAG TPA: NAD(+) synthase, partial [Fimbriiglobus sp.]|nr:NAD(+) synthase [Fimbriiglobus sp.]
MPTHGFLRVAAASPDLRVADCRFNAERTLDLLRQAEDVGADLAVFPELGLTGYTCNDLFHHRTLQHAALAALDTLLDAADLCFGGVAVVGLPLEVDGRLFNCAAVFHGGKLLGVVPKTYLPNYKEFYDLRFFAPGPSAVSREVQIVGQRVPFGADQLFSSGDGFVLGVEVCEDVWMPVPPSSLQAIAGATVLATLSASNETIGKAAYRRQLVAGQSGRCVAGYVYASCGPGESTTDLVFGGHCLITENGSILAESPRFRRGGHLTVADLDLDRLQRDRVTTNSFGEAARDPGLVREFRRVAFTLPDRAERTPTLMRHVDPHPFVPSDPATLRERCDEIFHTQVCGLAKRLDHVGRPAVSIGVSGGLDSTLGLLVACKTFDALGEPRAKIKALTMPGFGTTDRTLRNARALMRAVGVSDREADIRA